MLYYAIGRVIGPILVPFLNGYSKITHVQRARVLVENEYGEVLLVRSWVNARKWEFPGGGIGRHETPVAAVRRELYEETGALLPADHFTYLTTLQLVYVAPIFRVKATRDQFSSDFRNRWEIAALQRFSPDDLPSTIAPSIEPALRVLSKKH